jgi:putative thioredoxin
MSYEINDFQKDVIEKSKESPVLVDFWAEWCGPCKVISPILERLAEKYKNQWTLVKINTDLHQELAMKYGVRGIPNVKLFINGDVANEFTGAMPEKMIEDWLIKAIPGKYEKQIDVAALLVNSNPEAAKKILETVLTSEPENEKAGLLLAKILVFENVQESLNIIKRLDSRLENFELAESIKTFASLFEKVKLKELAEAEAKEKYISALNEMKMKNFDQALVKFIDIIKTDRNYDDDGARKACIAIFKFLGEEHEITLKHRRDFGSALNI